MLKDKFNLPHQKRVVLDRLGSLIIGFGLEDDLASDLGFDSGEELETFRCNGFRSKEPEEAGDADDDDDERKECEIDEEEKLQRESEVRICRREVSEIPKSISSSASRFWRKDHADKEAELEYELSQKVINLEALQRISSSGLPDGLRATTWKLLLGYLPADRDLWDGELVNNRQKYAALKEELLLDPSEFSRRNDTTMASNKQEREGNVDGLLMRQEVLHGDHPLSLGKASFWHQYFQDEEMADQIDRDLQRTHPDMRFFSGDSSFGKKNRKAMRNILLLFAKLNPAIRYVQGMNEVLAPLYYVFSTDLDAQNASNAEADSFSCFVRLLSDSVDHFCQQLDNSSVGILSTLSRLAELLKANDEVLWRHLESSTKVKPQFYAFRWITLLLTQEFDFHEIMRIWDSLLSNSLGIQEMLLRVCCAMLLCVRRELLKGVQMEQILLHGTLYVTILEAVALQNTPTVCGCPPKFLTKAQMAPKGKVLKGCSWIKRVSLCRRKELVEDVEESVDIGTGMPQLYATIDLEKARVGRTRIITNEPDNPRWNESFRIYCAHNAADVIVSIKGDNPVGASLIGRAYISVTKLLYDGEVDRWVDICDDHHQPLSGGAKIHVKLQFFDITREYNWSQGIRSPDFRGVPYTFFSQKQQCRVTLYQDSHVLDYFIPKIPLANGRCYEPQRCWEDIFDAITNARHLIYITGWSVYTEITLIRDPRRQKPGGDVTLGDLLKRKAREGVRVLMLVWDDRTSVSLSLLKKDGLMVTHDEDTAKYFHGTGVHCVLCPRNPDDGRSIIQGLETSSMFTHHQKIVVVDSEMLDKQSQQRRIVSFVGGIDLCDGRYDTHDHSLFRTLDTAHRNDFHQPNFPNSSIKKGGPREPWHDIHCCLEGPVAWDVLSNFEQRWRKQAGKDLLPLLKDLSNIVIPFSIPEDRETWNVQLFRSIDGGAAAGFPDTPEGAAEVGLVSGKDNVIDRSIQDAYINAIRRAKDFIYIENQYFLGSSFGWKAEGIKVEDIGALHLIPKELSLKIVSKIEAGQRFTVYVVVPMWPEGVPESASVQAILDWQRRTMEMMYSDIAQALRKRGLAASPKEYLTFFCLANREVKKSGEYTPTEKPEPDSDYSRAQQARRFMIYVHSKMMIVDDEYIIVGSANINQRSMDGARDSEIAMGAFQPHYLATRQAARGQIHGFRMALWYEHLSMSDDLFLQPQSMDCIRKVNALADKNWELYSGEKLERDLPGHLLSYPIGVTKDGLVTQLPGMEFFPDTKARILGTKSEFLPPILTT